MIELAKASDQLDALQEELEDLAQRVVADAAFNKFLSTPMVDVEARRKILEKLFRGGYSDLFVDSLQVLNRKGRLGLIRAVAKAYHVAREDLQGRVEVFVQSAAPLTAQHRQGVSEVAAAHTGKEVDLIETVDEAVLGGLVIRIGDEKYDASVATKIKTLAGKLLERASHEIHSGRDYVERTA
jgi:F-type H+-transporting ATPase subunit delta